MDRRAVGVVVVLVLAGVFVAFPAFQQVSEHNHAVQEYERTDGVVDESSYESRERGDVTEFSPSIWYEYTVAGETYSEINTYPGQFDRWNESEESVYEVVTEYPEGRPVEVYYDPDDPDDAYIHEADVPGAWPAAAGYAVATAVGGYWLLRAGRRRWRRRQRKREAITDVGSLSGGPVEIEGRATPGGTGPTTAPFSREGCLVAKYEVEQFEKSNDDGDDGTWTTLERYGTFQPFVVEDGTGRVRVEPTEAATFDLDPDGWTTTRVDSADRGPPPIQRFVEDHDEIDFPPDAPGQENDRRYRQNLLEPGETVSVHGTTTSRDTGGDGNGQHLVVTAATDAGVEGTTVTAAGYEETPMLLSTVAEPDFHDRPWWAFWRVPVGGSFLLVSLLFAVGTFAPMLGLPVPYLL